MAQHYDNMLKARKFIKNVISDNQNGIRLTILYKECMDRFPISLKSIKEYIWILKECDDVIEMDGVLIWKKRKIESQ